MSTLWKCTECSYSVKDEKPPEVCPSCNNKCAFVDKTDYTQTTGNSRGDDRI